MGFAQVLKDVLGITELERELERMRETAREYARRAVDAEAERSAAVLKSAAYAGHLQGKLDQSEGALEQLERDAVQGPQPPVEPDFAPCDCGGASWRVDLLTANVGVVEGRLVRREAGALVTCSRCGARKGFDEDGEYAPHRAAWPSAWVVEHELAKRMVDRKNEGQKNLRRRNSISGDLRLPPT